MAYEVLDDKTHTSITTAISGVHCVLESIKSQTEITDPQSSECVHFAWTFQRWRRLINDKQSPALDMIESRTSWSGDWLNPLNFKKSPGRACQAWWRRCNQANWMPEMTTQLTNLPCGTVEVRVCSDQICATGWVSSHHLVPTKEAQLRESVNRGIASTAE